MSKRELYHAAEHRSGQEYSNRQACSKESRLSRATKGERDTGAAGCTGRGGPDQYRQKSQCHEATRSASEDGRGTTVLEAASGASGQ